MGALLKPFGEGYALRDCGLGRSSDRMSRGRDGEQQGHRRPLEASRRGIHTERLLNGKARSLTVIGSGNCNGGAYRLEQLCTNKGRADGIGRKGCGAEALSTGRVGRDRVGRRLMRERRGFEGTMAPRGGAARKGVVAPGGGADRETREDTRRRHRKGQGKTPGGGVGRDRGRHREAASDRGCRTTGGVV